MEKKNINLVNDIIIIKNAMEVMDEKIKKLEIEDLAKDEREFNIENQIEILEDKLNDKLDECLCKDEYIDMLETRIIELETQVNDIKDHLKI